jgi:hypothetical protein
MDEIYYSLAQEWFASRDTDFFYSQPNHDACHSQVIRKRKVPVDCTFVSSAAIDTFVVAAISNRDSQVSDRAPEFVGQDIHWIFDS